jgi:lysophospholipase L1-like esterase
LPRYTFPAGTVTNTTGAPLRLTFHATNTTGRRETDLWTIDSSNNLSERIPNGLILTDTAGAYSAFAGPDDVDTLYMVAHNGSTRTAIPATGMVAGSGGSRRLRGASTYLPLNELKASADSGRSFGVSILSDSTADGGAVTKHWPYLWATDFAARYPNYTVNFYRWSDANQNYDALQAAASDTSCVIQAGTAGARYVSIINSTYSTPVADISRASTDLDVRVKADVAAWPPPAAGTGLTAHYGAAGQREYKFYLDTTQKMVVIFSQDGTATSSKSSSVISVTPGTPLWYRFTYVQSTGVFSFYTSTDGVAWTAASTGTATSGALYSAATAPFEFGGEQGTNSDLATGTKFYDVDIRDGVGGNRVSPWLLEHWQPYNAAGEANGWTGAPILNVLNGSRAGAGVTYLSDSTRLPLILPSSSQRAIVLAFSHNDTTSVGGTYLATLDTWLSAIRTLRPTADVVLCTQNPEIYTSGTSVRPSHHNTRRLHQIAWARRNGVGIIDAAQAFIDNPNYAVVDATYLIKADGTHPTNPGDTGLRGLSGSTTWANEVIAATGY